MNNSPNQLNLFPEYEINPEGTLITEEEINQLSSEGLDSIAEDSFEECSLLSISTFEGLYLIRDVMCMNNLETLDIRLTVIYTENRDILVEAI